MHDAVVLARRVLATVGALAVLAGLGACSTEETPNLGYSKQPLWTAKDLGLETLSGTLLRDDVAVVPGTNFDGGTLAVVDAQTGQARWSADDGDPLLGGDGIVAHHESPHDPIQPTIQELGNGDWNVLIPYRTQADQSTTSVSTEQDDDKPTKYGIAALSGKDGRLVWASEPLLTVKDPADSEQSLRAIISDGGTVLAATSQKNDIQRLTTWALNADSGETRWTEKNVWPVALSGGRAIVETVGKVDGILLEEGPERKNSAVQALDLTSGKPVWDLSNRYESSTVDSASGDYLVVRTTIPESERKEGEGENATVMLRADTGKTTQRVGDFELCHVDEPLIACQPGDDLEVFRTDTPQLQSETSQPFGDRSSWEVLDVFGDTIVVNDHSDGEDQVKAVDSDGELISEKLIAEPVTMSEDYAVFCKRELQGCGMYATGKKQPDKPDKAEKASVDKLAIGKKLWGRQDGSWGGGSADMSQVNEAEIVRDSVVYQGSLRRDRLDATVVADVDSGDARWQLHSDNASRTVDGETVRIQPPILGVPEFAETDDGWWALLPYDSDDASGIAALSGKDGKVAWTLPLGPPDADIDINDVTGTRAAVTVTPDGADEQDGKSTGTVVDLSKPELLWKQKGTTASDIASDTVLIKASGKPDKLTALQIDEPERQRWTLDGKGKPPEVVGVFGNLVIARVADGTAVLDRTSGKELARIGKSVGQCEGDRKLVACNTSVSGDTSDRPGAPVVLHPTKSGVQISDLRSARTTEVNNVHDGRIFLDATEELGYRSVDAKGVTVDTDLPGRLAGTSDEGYALFVSGQSFANVTWDVHLLK